MITKLFFYGVSASLLLISSFGTEHCHISGTHPLSSKAEPHFTYHTSHPQPCSQVWGGAENLRYRFLAPYQIWYWQFWCFVVKTANIYEPIISNVKETLIKSLFNTPKLSNQKDVTTPYLHFKTLINFHIICRNLSYHISVLTFYTNLTCIPDFIEENIILVYFILP